jgi:hypothetical protein
MAKSIHLSELETPYADITAPLSRGSFWEHWFEGQPRDERPQAGRALDEHGIWKKAVNLEILALEEKKF